MLNSATPADAALSKPIRAPRHPLRQALPAAGIMPYGGICSYE
jgi:hypothetical protein